MTVGMMYSFPSKVDTPAMDVATAAVEPEIIVGIPPNNDVMRDITIVFWMPVFGDSPIINANAMDSGINNSAIVRPERNSFTSNVGDADVTAFMTVICSVILYKHNNIYTVMDKVMETDDGNGAVALRDAITIDGTTYDITDFKHPGGNIINYVKNTADATEVFREFHHRSSDRVNKVLQSLPICPESAQSIAPEHVWTDRQNEMTADFREMRAKLVAQGLFEPDYIHVYFRMLELAFYFGMGTWLASYNIYASILSFIAFKTRCGWVQHEGGQLSFT